MVIEPNKVVQALRVLQEEEREDLIKEGVLEQVWVGLKSPKRSSAEGVTAAVLAYTSPEKSPKKFRKFKSKGVSGRKVSASPERIAHVVEKSPMDLPVVRPVRRGGVRVARRSGASFRQRVAAVGRESLPVVAVHLEGQEVACGDDMHVLNSQRAPQAAACVGGLLGRRQLEDGSKQAPLAVEMRWSASSRFLKKLP
ncbi:hypothetical protein NDU88_005395 [Pleurodeles waltl]|uniref:Uncharacterized protein n=1 Tax=Pleurodeles waltl TaxID=8319 RepID=A0AAV7RM72_PLEWA|nr:hypothetical protein NDU88_005395 [Pleurodeles waltl]